MFVLCFVSSLKLSHSVWIKAASGAAQINVLNISGDTSLMGCNVSEGEAGSQREARRASVPGVAVYFLGCGGTGGSVYIMSSCGFGRRRVSVCAVGSGGCN